MTTFRASPLKAKEMTDMTCLKTLIIFINKVLLQNIIKILLGEAHNMNSSLWSFIQDVIFLNIFSAIILFI